MQDEESFSFQLNKTQVLSSQSVETSLITLERAQKLDLLIHLITNLRASLVVCGPAGIGKATLLGELKDRKQDVWPIVSILGSDSSSFESIQKQTLSSLTKFYPEYKNQELSSVLSSLDKQSKKVVVVIGGAGQLVPGLISSVIEYAAVNECLRVVFSLTQDELHLKNSSDKSIDDCHFIEVPPLTEKQCGVFLQNLSAKPGAVVSFNAISELMVERVYRKTHGIPGRIIAELPSLSNFTASSSYQWLVYVFFAVVFILAGVQFFVFNESDKKPEAEQIKTALFLDDIKATNISPPVVYTNKQEVTEDVMKGGEGSETTELVELPKKEVLINTVVNNAEQLIAVETPVKIIKEPQVIQNKAEGIELAAEKKEFTTGLVVAVDENRVETALIEKKIIIEKEKKDVTEVKGALLADEAGDDSQWVLDQAKKNYTIQIMVLSTRESVDEFTKKNNSLKEQLKFFQVNKQNQKYVLIYGSFKSAVSASKKMKSLPVQYRKSWVRKIIDLQKEIKK